MNPEQIAISITMGFQTLTPASPLWEGLIGLLDHGIETEQQALCGPGVVDSEAHRGRGRLGVYLELKSTLLQLMEQAKTPKDQQGE